MKHNPLSFQINTEKFSFASESEKRGTNLMRPNSTFFVDGLKRFAKNPVAMVSFVFIFLVVLAVFIIPLFYPYKFNEILCFRYGDVLDSKFTYLRPFEYAPKEIEAMENGVFVPPHILGTDKEGHDYFICLIIGAKSLM